MLDLELAKDIMYEYISSHVDDVSRDESLGEYKAILHIFDEQEKLDFDNFQDLYMWRHEDHDINELLQFYKDMYTMAFNEIVGFGGFISDESKKKNYDAYMILKDKYGSFLEGIKW